MCRNHIFYMNKMLLSVCILFCINIWNVQCQTKLLHSHKTPTFDDYDITTIYKITNPLIFNDPDAGFKNNKFLATYKGNYSIEIHSGTNALGMPIQAYNDFTLSTNDNELFFNGSLITKNSVLYSSNIDYRLWEKRQLKLNGHNCKYETYDQFDRNNNFLGNSNIINSTGDYCYTVLMFKYYIDGHNHYQTATIMSLVLKPDRYVTCLTITYTLRLISYTEIEILILDDGDKLIFSTYFEKNDDISTLKVDDLNLKKDLKYKVVLKRKLNPEYNYLHGPTIYRGIWFALHQITLGSKYDEDNIQKVSINNLESYPKPFGVLGKENQVVDEKNSTSKSMCLNGGFTLSNQFQCICPPGFIGQFCEKACGMNSYKADCQGVCSLHPSKMCHGILMCKKNYGCTCPPGLTGPLCNEDCALGTYGNNCTQTCSSNCLDSACNKYTGACSSGCVRGFIPPKCQSKYPYFSNPPKLQSTNFETLEFELNFQTDYIKGGDNNLKMKYYLLTYKVLSENKFHKSEIKCIDENINVTQEIISNLLPDTKYNVGVLIVTDDGNFNDQHVVYGEYKTLCKVPSSIDYNIEVISKIRNAKISWEKITPKYLECNIIEYILTLTYHKSQNQTYGVQEVISTMENSFVFDDLYPGHSYSLFMTAKTSEGLLPLSPIHFFTTQYSDNDVKIKDAVAIFENKTLTITWKLADLYDNEISAVNQSVICVVKYKIIRTLSCSLKERNDKWVTLQYANMTTIKMLTTLYNTQYSIQIGIAVNGSKDIQNSVTINTLTPTSKPEVKPTIDLEHPIIVSNHSVFFQWKFDPIKSCSKLNGLFSKFRVELKDIIDDNDILIKETKMNYIKLDQLNPNTAYELKVFVETHTGYNIDYFLSANFTTKIKMLNSVKELVVYKMDQQNNTVGLRWSYSEENELDGFIISIDTFNHSDNKESVIGLTKCSAWPTYYCHTIKDLTPNTNYTFKIKPKSNNDQNGGKESLISFDTTEGITNAPTNVIVTRINSTTVNLQWDIPFIFNSSLQSFSINVKEIATIENGTCCKPIPPYQLIVVEELPTYNYMLTSLKPESTYSIVVSTISKQLHSGIQTPELILEPNLDE